MAELVRTPEARFEGLPGYDYDAEYVSVGEPEMAYVDEGDGEETFLCLHGEPTYSYLYRKMVPPLAEQGRVLAPDFVGFGRSEKYTDEDAYSFDRHFDWLVTFLEELDLDGLTLVCQDWGGILGLAAAAHHPERFDRIVPMNTGIPDGTQEMPEVWHQFREMVETADHLDVAPLVEAGCATELPEPVLDGYRAPFHTEAVKASVRTWPGMVPLSPDDEGAAVMRATRERLADWEKPAFVLFSDSDPITRPSRDPLREFLPTAGEQPDVWVEGAGHFLQEDAGEAVAEHIAGFVDRT
ncbi:haloalkane dehalogenase [Haloarchaeobius iranensis]|uniref:Haloalkane dehalogenase n=1 Tax=Haloarchaeobius iranensis TaxID=996166 RepID=A0A1G9ZVG7_9EURY|nr:haloalkane dehalogenase [Haloarchaeobius iranensis]SDN24683.1 haloalkane dehalogenase [Haloarchaeobius iranensis]